MKIEIKTFEENNQISREKLFGANIYINKQWFKEITGLPTEKDLLQAIMTNEDLLSVFDIKEQKK